MDISFIIVSFNTKDLVVKAIESIYKFAKDISFEIILVDNNSQDGTVSEVKKKFPKVILIAKKENLGFGNGNNEGIKIAKGKYLFFFNSDAYLIDDSLKNLLVRAKEIPNLGAISPLILNVDQTVQQSGGFLPSLLKIFWWMSFIDDLPFGLILKPYHIDHDSFYKKERKLEWLTGAAFMVPKDVIAKVGPFDKNIFMYGEDVELFYRIGRENLRVIMSPLARIVHIGQGSSGKISTNAILGEYKGIIYYYRKYKNGLSLQIALILLKMGALLRFAIFALLGRRELSKTYIEAFKLLN